MFKNIFRQLKRQKTPIYFVNSTVFSTVVTLLSGFITYRYVAPEYLGVWVTLTTFTVYATFLRLGIPNGMNRELPYYLGKNETDKAYAAAETTLAYSIYITAVLAILALVFLFFFDYGKYGSLEVDFRHTMYVVIFKVLTEPYSTYLSGTFRTNDNFKKLSDIQMITSLVRLASVVLVYFWGFQGYLLREFVISFVNLSLLHLWRPMPKVKIRFTLSIFKNLFSVGFRMFLVSYASSFIGTLPRLYIINEGTSKDMGLFSPAVMLLGMVILIPNTLTQYLYPKFSFAYGVESNRVGFWKKIRLVYFLSVIISLFLGAAVFFSIDFLIQYFPKYTEAVPYIKFACLPALFVGYNLGNVLFVVFKEWKWLWFYTILYGVLQFSTLRLFGYFTADILKSVMLSLLVTYAIMFFYSVFATYKITRK